MRLIIILFLLSSCVDETVNNTVNNHTNDKTQDRVNTNLIDSSNTSSQSTFDESKIQLEQQRIEEILKNYSKPIEKIETDPSYEEINALYGQGFKVKNEPVKCKIYVFDHQNQHGEVLKFFEGQKDYDSTKSVMASNGSLFFFGEITSDKADAIYLLNDLVSVFAGEE